MTQKLYHTKKYAVMGVAACFLWMYVATTLLNHEFFSGLPMIIRLEGALNISLLIMMMVLIRCLVLLFKERPLLQAGENGLHLQVSGKNRGIVPWRHITHFACSQDRRQVRIYLRGLWDIPEDCGERFDIQSDENRQRMIVLPLHRKVRNVEHVRDELEEWLLCYSDGEVFSCPEMDELSQRRIASAKTHGAASALVPLYFIRSKFWILTIIGYLFFAAIVERWAEFSRPVVLCVSAVPALLTAFLIRKLLSKAISALERSKERNQERMIGL